MQFESTPPIMLARTELEHAMYNLLLNARDASPPGAGITIACGTRVIGPDTKVPLNPGVYAELSVIDRGPGLSPARLAEAIAERKSTKGPHRGSGLGLSTVHALATRRGGTLISEPGEVPGARMTLLLPAVSEPHLRDAAALVVDADPDVRNIVARTLERDWKMTAATADRAEIGHLGPFSIAVVSAAAIDPATLSTLPSLQGVPTLILLPADTPTQPSDAHLYLAKPFSAEQLSRALRRLLMPR
jgi:hypothetical protein